MRTASPSLADLITAFFTRHLAAELKASAHTVSSYRDTFRLLLTHIAASTGRPVARLTVEDLGPQAILGFLESLERDRRNCIRTRNARLAAIRSFFTDVVAQEPTVSAAAHRVLRIPFKKSAGKVIDYLTREEVEAILAQPDRRTAKGRRDYLLLALLYDTGARVSEVLVLSPADFRLDRLPLVRVTGKGRKQRIVPLLPVTAGLVRSYTAETGRVLTDTVPLLCNARGHPLSRAGAAFVLAHYRARAVASQPMLGCKRITPHTFRHTKAMHLLQAGIATVTIKDILGHAHLKTVEAYVRADLEMKRQALEASPSPVSPTPLVPRHEPNILSWLESL